MKFRSLIPPAPLFFHRIALAIHGLLCSHTNCKTFLFYFVENAIDNLVGIALNLYIALGNVVIFSILILPIQEHSISLHLFVSFFISIVSIL